MAWPARAELWGERLVDARRDYAQIARAIAGHEPVLMLARAQDVGEAADLCGPGVEILACSLDDSWVRDTGPLFVRDGSGAMAGVDFAFNGWGGKYEPYDADASLARRLLEKMGVTRHAVACVLEGGAVDVDGEGTLVTTETVLLHPSRNPTMTREDLELVLRRHLGAEKVIWLAGGLVEDRDTDGHVDNVCHFVGPARVLVQTVADPANPNYAICRENVRRLREARDARGRRLEVVELPYLPYLPGSSPPVVAPYMNFYLANGAVIVPVTGQPDDERALQLIASALPGRDVVAVPGATLAYGGGGVHCITQQQPETGRPTGPIAAPGTDVGAEDR
jgi:agmatine deiminase